MDVTFCMRQAIEKSNLWGVPLFLLRFDIRKAFDSIDHGILTGILEDLGISPALILAVLKELVFCQVDVRVGQHSSDRLPMHHGSKQGGRDTPRIWKIFLWGILRPLIQSWEDRGLVVCFGHTVLNVQLWADDGILYASSKQNLETKFRELVETLHSALLALKPDPDCLQWMCSASSWAPSSPILFGQDVYSVQHVDSIVHLGSCIDSMNSVSAAIAHRLKVSWQHWHDRKSQLCRRRVPLRKRILRWFQTVGKTLCFGLGELNLLNEHIAKLDSFNLYCLRCMLSRRRPTNMTPWDFNHRLNVKIRGILREMNQPLAGSLAVCLQHTWAGHVERSDPTSLCRCLMHYRDASWWAEQQTLPAHKRHRRVDVGRPITWESRLSRCHGNKWWELCSDRLVWKQYRAAFVADRLWDSSADITFDPSLPIEPSLYTATYFDSLRLLSPPTGARGTSDTGLRYLIVGDSDFTLKAARGKALAQAPHLASLHRRLVKTLFYLGHFLHLEPGNPDGGLFHVPRADNSAADELATWALLSGRTEEKSEFSVTFAPGDHIIAYFDGGSRENGSRGGAGVVVVLLSRLHPSPVKLYEGSFFLGGVTHDEAEATGMMLAMVAIIRFVQEALSKTCA